MSRPAREYTVEEIRSAIQTAIECSASQRDLAKAWGVSPSYLTDLRLGRRLPGPSILKHFGMKRVVEVKYVRDDNAMPTSVEGGGR